MLFKYVLTSYIRALNSTYLLHLSLKGGCLNFLGKINGPQYSEI